MNSGKTLEARLLGRVNVVSICTILLLYMLVLLSLMEK